MSPESVSASPPEKPISVRNSLVWTSLGQAGFFLLQFGSTVILAHLLTPPEMGVFALGAAMVGLISIVQALGLNNYLIRAEQVARPMVATVFTINLVLSVALALVAVGVGFVSDQFFQNAGTSRVMDWLATTPIVGAIGLVPMSLMQREGNFRALSLLRIVSTAAGTILTVVLAFAGQSYMSLAYGWVLTCTLNAVGACVLAPQHVHWRPALHDWRAVSSFGFKMMLINGTLQVQRQLLNLAVGRILGLAAVGLYARANSLFNLLFENIQTAAVRVLLVDFAQAARTGAPLRERYLTVVEFMTALLWPFFGGLAVLSGPCVRLLYGAKWQMISLPLSMLCVTGILWVVIAMAWELFIITNETALQVRLELIRAVLGTLLFVIGCFFGLDVAVATRILESIISIILYAPHIVRFTGSQAGDFAPVYLRSALLTAVAIAPSSLLMFAFGWSPLVPLTWVFSSILLGVAGYGVAMLLLGHPLLTEVERIVRRRMGQRRPALRGAE